MTVPVTRVVLRVIARPETVEQLRPALFELAAQSRKEDGCNGYKVFQSQSNPLEFVCYEILGKRCCARRASDDAACAASV